LLTYNSGLHGLSPIVVLLSVGEEDKLKAFFIAAAFSGLAVNPFGTAGNTLVLSWLTKESMAFSTCLRIVPGVATEFGKLRPTPRVKVRWPVVGEVVLIN
jgi:hypothetical protein